MPRRVVIYELNEVPWEIIDLYTQARPSSCLASLLSEAATFTTVDDDPVPLQPWRTWPTFHKSLYTAEHKSFDLGQDPGTFRGENLWDVAERAGLTVGLFGPLQSWPSRRFANGGFFVPDTFSQEPDTDPPDLQRFQAFNLAMTQSNVFTPDTKLDAKQLVRIGGDLTTKGFTAWSAWRVASHLALELADRRYKARRSTMQVLPSFDLYWRMHRRHAPHLSIFFTNHVAGMMHRYWGDWVPGYAEAHEYRVDKVFGRFVMHAMDIFDHQLRAITKYCSQHPETIVIIAASMGQGAIDHEEIADTYVLDEPDRLISALRLEGADQSMSMYPRTSLRFPDERSAELGKATVASLEATTGPLFDDLRVAGRTLSISIAFDAHPDRRQPGPVRYLPVSGDAPVEASLDDVGVAIRERMGGGNTAYHVPEGIVIAWGRGVPPDDSRSRVSVLDAAPSILDLVGVEAPPQMQGKNSMFTLGSSDA